MNDTSSYKLVGLLALLPKGAIFLNPVWQEGERYYLQRVNDQTDQILTFDRVDISYEQEIGAFIPWPPKGKKARIAKPGHSATYAFRFPDFSFEVGGRARLAPIIHKRIEELTDYPITKVHMLEFLEDVDALPQAIEEAWEFMVQHGAMLTDKWKRDRMNHLHWLRQRLRLGKRSVCPGWYEITHDFLAGLEPTSTQLSGFFHGERPDWSLIREGKLPLRTCVQNVTAKLSEQQSGAVLLLGSSGEGKTTALMQIGWAWLQAGFRLFWMIEEEADPLQILKIFNEPVAILMDDAAAHGIVDLRGVLDAAQTHSHPVRIGLTARLHEWRHRYAQRLDRHSFLHVEQISRLQGYELDRIAQGVIATGGVPGLTYEDFRYRLDTHKTKDLLVAMLLATDGRPLREILKDMLARIRAWPEDGETLVLIIGVVAGLECRTTTKDRAFPATYALLAEIFQMLPARLRDVLGKLPGELALRSDNETVMTRHPLIAEALWEVLTGTQDSMIDKMDMDRFIIQAGADLTRMQGKKVRETEYLSVIPGFYQKMGDVDGARQLYRFASEEAPRNPFIWQNWALLETSEKNIGTLETAYTARWLFNQAVTVAPNDAPSWQAWGLLEANNDNLGTVEQPYTARWLFNQGVKGDPKHAPLWQAWGLLEANNDNLGTVEEPYTARWLYKQAVTVDPKNAPSWQAWGLLEEKAGNLGSLKEPYTARWLLNKVR